MWVTYGAYQNKHEFDGGTMGVRWDVKWDTKRKKRTQMGISWWEHDKIGENDQLTNHFYRQWFVVFAQPTMI